MILKQIQQINVAVCYVLVVYPVLGHVFGNWMVIGSQVDCHGAFSFCKLTVFRKITFGTVNIVGK